MAVDENGRSIASVLRDIVLNVQDIVRAEVRLAKREVGQEALKVKTAGILLGLGAVAGFFAVLFALAAIVFALSRVMPSWAAAVVVSITMGIIGALLGFAGRHRLSLVHLIPERTAETLKEDFEWMKPQVK